MSSESQPITLTRFATALNDLPIDAIYSKYSELRNNIAHMESSNNQLEEFARENDDRDCYEALLENKQVIKRFEERLDALKREVTDVRGLPWRPREEESKVEKAAPVTNGVNGTGDQRPETVAGADTAAQGGNEEDGVFL
ncbi:hypothetical protein DE146DRAFT_30343 [Phaeosphaeria sp. MPI-PUGE-AT-0046c]|nr:hypothetical protein DE146DRAFT_30343 [Phaeosphaeria sp. MPI-PUGE-AT-0046c]